METFKELIKKRGIKEPTQKVYAKRLEELLDNLNDKKHDSLDILKEPDKILKYIDQFKYGKKKSFLNACLAGLSPESTLTVPKEHLPLYKIYGIQLKNINKYERKINEEQIKTKRQEDKWTTMAELEKIRDDYGTLLKKKKYNSASKEFKDPRDRSLMLKYLIASLYTMLPPRRLEYGNMKRINELEASHIELVAKIEILQQNIIEKEDDASTAREEREWQRRRVLELEGQLEDNERIMIEEKEIRDNETQSEVLEKVNQVQAELVELQQSHVKQLKTLQDDLAMAKENAKER